MIRSAKMRDLIEVWYLADPPTLVGGSTGEGEIDEDASTKLRCKRYAEVRTPRGKEKEVSQQLTAEITHLVHLRFDAETDQITPSDWITLRDGTRLDVLAAFDPDRRRREIQLHCKQNI